MEERAYKQLFEQLAEEQRKDTPDFEQLWAKAAQGKGAGAKSRGRVFYLSLAAAASLVFMLCWKTGLLTSQEAETFTQEQIFAWEAESDVLLEEDWEEEVAMEEEEQSPYDWEAPTDELLEGI